MSSLPDYHLGDLDGEYELYDHEPHKLRMDHGVTEVPKEVPEMKCLGNRAVREKFAPSDREEGMEVSRLQWNVV